MLIIQEKIMKVTLLGAVIAFILSSVFHEMYGIFGENYGVGLIFPVNESKWEHWKIVFWPMLLVGIFNYILLRSEGHNILFATAIAILVAEIVTFGLIELYEVITASHAMWIHIVSLLIGIVVGQLSSYWVMTATKLTQRVPLLVIGVAIILINIVILIAFTIKPPKTEYFKDSESGTYGINREMINN